MDTYGNSQRLYFVNIELAWEKFHVDLFASREGLKFRDWLVENIGDMGDVRADMCEWMNVPNWKWAWSLTSAHLNMPVGIYFRNREDVTRFMLTFSDVARLPHRLGQE